MFLSDLEKGTSIFIDANIFSITSPKNPDLIGPVQASWNI
jgi:hypothetical protein